jgi:hypothetical protein
VNSCEDSDFSSYIAGYNNVLLSSNISPPFSNFTNPPPVINTQHHTIKASSLRFVPAIIKTTNLSGQMERLPNGLRVIQAARQPVYPLEVL